MNVGYKHTPYNCKSSTASGLIESKKGPLLPQKHHPAKFSGYVLVVDINKTNIRVRCNIDSTATPAEVYVLSMIVSCVLETRHHLIIILH